MQEAAPARNVIKFGAFEVDPHAQELRKSGLRIKLQDQPFQVLSVLLERPGELVTRDELRHRLWPDGTFVDFEHSLNTAVKKLREALGDDADHPRFIETLHRKGYRFVAAINDGSEAVGNIASAASAVHRARGNWRPALLLAIAGLAVLFAILMTRGLKRHAIPAVTASRALTTNAKVLTPNYWLMHFPGVFTDGSRIYFSTYDGAFGVSQVSVAGGEVSRIPLPLRGILLHVSSDGSKLLVKQVDDPGQQEGPLWEVPSTGGKPVRIGEIIAHDAAWSPDRRSLVFASDKQISIARDDGSAPRTIAELTGLAYWLRWSPDGRWLRFTLVDPNLGTSIWEIDIASSQAKRLLSQWNGKTQLCCGEWSGNGRYFAFIARDANHSQIVLRRETAGIFRDQVGKLVGLAAGPLDYHAAIFSSDSKTLYAVSASGKAVLAKFDLKGRKLEPFVGGLEGQHVDYSRDDKWITYSGPNRSDANIWRARADGSETIQLTRQPLFAIFPRWSPDGKQIVFVGKVGEGPYKLYVIPRDGGTPRKLIEDQRNEIDPGWSPDGHKIIFGRPPDILAEPGMKKAIHLLDVKTRQVSTLPGSEGLYSPHWSPDGRYIAALTVSIPWRPVLYDTLTQKWRPLPTNGNEFCWAHDSKSIFAAEYSVEYESAKVPVYRIWLNGNVDHIMDLDKIAQVNVVGCSCCLSVTPDNSPLLNCRSGTSNLYALDLDLP